MKALADYANGIRTEIERQTRDLTRELRRVEQAIEALSEEESIDSEKKAPGDQRGEYKDLGPQAAVEKYLKEHEGKWVRSRSVANTLKAGGLTVADPRLLRQQVLVALKRAVKKGLADREILDGKPSYKWSSEQDNQHG
jgi:hypothetical protein